jgi:uncharacterized protein (TIRG00374 family)
MPRRRWLRWLLLVVGVLAFALVVRTANPRGTVEVIESGGPWLALGALPYLVQIGLDALSWRTLLRGLGHRIRWRRLFAIRLSTEAVLMSMPAGGFVGETLKPYLLFKTDKVPPAEAIASIGIKKCLLAFAEAVYMGTALVVGWSLLTDHSQDLIHRGGLPWLAVLAIAFLVLFATGLSLALLGGSVGARIHRALMRVPSRRFRAWIAARREPFAATDSAFRRLGQASRGRILAAGSMLVGAWFTEACETWILLQLLGVPVSWVQALTMEAMVVFLRNLAFFVPAGLGVQDAGYLAFLRAFGVAGASSSAAAFVIVKRAKELLWVAIGYLTLFVLQAGTRAAPADSAPVLLSTPEVT